MNNSGQILLEVLVAIAIASMVVVLGSQLIFLSLAGNKISGDSDVADGLVEETFEAVRASAAENWNNIYSLSHGSTDYYPQKSSAKWVLSSGKESIPYNMVNYSRSFTVQNVCRDIYTKAITGITDNNGADATCLALSGSRHDPSTQKINVFVSWLNSEQISSSDYLTRWGNKTCWQTGWNSTGSGVNVCPAAIYDSVVNITPGASLQLCVGGC